MAVKRGTFDTIIESQDPKSRYTKAAVPLEEIKDRPSGDTRKLNDKHVADLMESIAAVGLIQPIAIDSVGHLLAGGHRRQAIAKLKQTKEKRFNELFPKGIPVRRFDFDASKDPNRLLEIEATENFQRRDYSPAEVRAIAERLRDAGYVEQAGRVKKGTKRLRPELANITGKSIRTITRYLSESESETEPDPIEPDVPIELIPKHVRALKRLENDFSEFDAIAKQAAKLRRLLEKQLEE